MKHVQEELLYIPLQLASSMAICHYNPLQTKALCIYLFIHLSIYFIYIYIYLYTYIYIHMIICYRFAIYVWFLLYLSPLHMMNDQGAMFTTITAKHCTMEHSVACPVRGKDTDLSRFFLGGVGSRLIHPAHLGQPP